MAREISTAETEEIREIFDHFDRNKNGKIETSELTDLLNALGSDMDEDEIKLGLSIVDSDGNGTIEWGEFLTWWSETRSA